MGQGGLALWENGRQPGERDQPFLLAPPPDRDDDPEDLEEPELDRPEELERPDEDPPDLTEPEERPEDEPPERGEL